MWFAQHVSSMAMRLTVRTVLLGLEFGWRWEESLVKNMARTIWSLELPLTEIAEGREGLGNKEQYL